MCLLFKVLFAFPFAVLLLININFYMSMRISNMKKYMYTCNYNVCNVLCIISGLGNTFIVYKACIQ